MRFALVLLFAAGPLAAAPVPKEVKNRPLKLDGAWALTGVELSGQVLPRSNIIWTFAGDTVRQNNDRPERITVDPQASPKEFQWGGVRTDWLGVYEITGDTLHISVSSQSGVRPTDTAAGPRVIRYTLKRVPGQ